MLKKITLSFIALLISPATTSATNIYTPDQLMQGSTMEISIPAYDITEVTGTFNNEAILFYKIEQIPKPEETISRAEFLEIMFKNHDFGEVDTNNTKDFPDVINTSPYYKYIQKAAALGIVSGYEDGKFRPYSPITRGQITKVLTNAFTSNVTPTSNVGVTLDVVDVPTNHRFFQNIQTAMNQGWFKGYPDGLMRPDRNINFTEAEIVITRAAKPETFTPLNKKPYFHAYTAIHRTATPSPKQLKLTITTPEITETKIIDIEIQQRPVPTIRFSLAKEKTDLFGNDAQDKTWTSVDAARATPSSTLYFTKPFIAPTTGEITLGFGDKLYINGTYSGSHFGIDYANREGTEIKAANRGLVTLAEYTPAFGNTVIIDHGQNIFSMYLHMSDLKTKKDQLVEQGDLIGLMGSTGISSGPHLHYTIFIGNIIVDSDKWI